MQQLRQIMTELLRRRPLTYGEIAEHVSGVLRRTEEARIYKWHKATGGGHPPRRPVPNTG